MKSLRLQALTAATFLLLALLLPFGSAASAVPATQAAKPGIQASKATATEQVADDMADGQIKSVQCKGKSLDMVFDASDEILRLHTDNYFKVDFSAINFTPKGIMNPCKQAKGMYARVYYNHIKGHPHRGILVSVEFRE